MPRACVGSILFLVASALPITAQQKPLSPEGQRLIDAFAELQTKPDDPTAQEQYLKVFPHDYKSFLALFDLDRELYDGYKFIIVLPSLAKNHENEVGRVLTQLSKDAHKEADAPTYLQYATAVYADEHTKTFVGLLQQLPPGEHANLVTFLGDVENHRVYGQYQGIIDHMRGIGRDDLAREFEVAREKRLQRRRR